MRMELRDLRTLLCVVRSGSFTAAASELGYTQSAVSQQIAGLEAELGQRLLERRPVRPTAAGARLAEHAARILLRVDAARTEMLQLAREAAPLRVGVAPLAAPRLLATAIRALRIEQPALRVVVRTLGPAAAAAAVAEGRVDAALVDGITAPDSPLALVDAGVLASTFLLESPLAVVLPADHPLARRSHLDLEVLDDAPWVLHPTGTRRVSGFVAYEGDDLATLVALVAGGHGSALLPLAACDGVAGIVGVPLRRPALVHRTEALMPRGPNPAVVALVEALRAGASLS